MDDRDLDDWSDHLGDEEYPDDEGDEDSAETVVCGQCGGEYYEDAVRCPHCGSYNTLDTSPWSGRSWWWIALGLLGIVALVLALSLGF